MVFPQIYTDGSSEHDQDIGTNMKTWLGLAVLTGAIVATVSGCASFEQTADETWSRRPGERLLSTPQPVAIAAREHWQFAWLSEAAYQDSRTDKAKASRCIVPDHILEVHGWSRWSDFPRGQLAEKMNRTHLRVDVWYHQQANILAVAFGGTVATSGKDWLSNLRWFIVADDNDEYSVLVRDFIPALQTEFHARAGRPGYEQLSSARLISTGHSLGGGLAQQFAYALVPDKELPRVTAVYAFNSSPVTGFYSVDKNIRNANSKQLRIERIYERGEGLATVRSILAGLYPPSESAPTIVETRYALFWKPTVFSLRAAIDQHSIVPLATKMTIAAAQDGNLVRRIEKECPEQVPAPAEI